MTHPRNADGGIVASAQARALETCSKLLSSGLSPSALEFDQISREQSGCSQVTGLACKACPTVGGELHPAPKLVVGNYRNFLGFATRGCSERGEAGNRNKEFFLRMSIG